VERGLYRAIDRKSLQNYGNLDAEFLRRSAVVDPENRFAVPYLWGHGRARLQCGEGQGAVGAEARVDSLALIFDPESARRLSRAAASRSSTRPASVVPAALLHLGKPPMSRDPRDLATAMPALGAAAPR